MAGNSEIIESVGKELKENEPSIVSRTREKYGPQRSRKQKIAIMLSKSRKLGAKGIAPQKGPNLFKGASL